MNPAEIKDLIAKGRTEQAIKATKELTHDTELEDSAITISGRYRKYKNNVIIGVLDENEKNKEHAVITHQVLMLLNEYELLQIKSIHNNFGQLKTELEAISAQPDAAETLETVKTLKAEMDADDYAGAGSEQKAERLGKIRTFLNNLSDPDSKAGKAIQMVKDGVDIVQDIAASYNSVAEWVGLPVVPRLFLKKLD